MIVRTAIKEDIPALAELYRNSVSKIAPQQYSPAQVEAWAAFATETESFTKFILEATTFIAEENNPTSNHFNYAIDQSPPHPVTQSRVINQH